MEKRRIISKKEIKLVTTKEGLVLVMDETGLYHAARTIEMLQPSPRPLCGRPVSLGVKVSAVPRGQVCLHCIRKANGGIVPADLHDRTYLDLSYFARLIARESPALDLLRWIYEHGKTPVKEIAREMRKTEPEIARLAKTLEKGSLIKQLDDELAITKYGAMMYEMSEEMKRPEFSERAEQLKNRSCTKC